MAEVIRPQQQGPVQMAGGIWKKGQYVNDDMEQKLKLYKYAGGDFGLLYIYFYNPVAKWLVEFLPMNLAPNVVSDVTLSHLLLDYTRGLPLHHRAVCVPVHGVRRELLDACGCCVLLCEWPLLLPLPLA